MFILLHIIISYVTCEVFWWSKLVTPDMVTLFFGILTLMGGLSCYALPQVVLLWYCEVGVCDLKANGEHNRMSKIKYIKVTVLVIHN
jgi:hypothetical protein